MCLYGCSHFCQPFWSKNWHYWGWMEERGVNSAGLGCPQSVEWVCIRLSLCGSWHICPPQSADGVCPPGIMAEKKGWTRGNQGKNARNEGWAQPSRSVQRQHVLWTLSGTTSGLRTHICACLWAKNLQLIKLQLMSSCCQLTTLFPSVCSLILVIRQYTMYSISVLNLKHN